MRRHFGFLTTLLLGLATVAPGTVQVSAQGPDTTENTGVSPERVIGEVTATDPEAKELAIKSDAGGKVTVILQEKTVYLRVPPGEKDIKKAAKITPKEIGKGDRVLARGRVTGDQGTISATSVIVMTKADIAQKIQRDRAAWQKRAVAGTITALDPETKQITLAVRSREGTSALVIEPVQNVVFRRYTQDSVRFTDAQTSSFAELKVGDPVRVLGEKSADGKRIKPEEIVSGSFRNIAGIVNAIDPAAGEIRITDLQTNKSLNVRITSDSMVRRMPAAKAAAGGAGAGTQRTEGGASGAPARQQAQPSAPAPGSGSDLARNGTAASAPAKAEGQRAEGGPPSAPARQQAQPGAPAPGSGSDPARNGTAASGAAKAEGQRAEGGPPSASARQQAQPGATASGSGSDATRSGAPGGGGLNLEQMTVLSLTDLKRDDAVLVLSTSGADPSHVTAIVLLVGVETLLSSAPNGQPQIGGIWNFFDISLP